ncbi:MAG: hypothetical protein U1E60_01775 [Reyranellaceae bacterium]
MEPGGHLPALTSAQKVDGGTGRDTFRLFGGALNENDSLFGQITNVEILTMAAGKFNNSLLMNFFANNRGWTRSTPRAAAGATRSSRARASPAG